MRFAISSLAALALAIPGSTATTALTAAMTAAAPAALILSAEPAEARGGHRGGGGHHGGGFHGGGGRHGGAHGGGHHGGPPRSQGRHSVHNHHGGGHHDRHGHNSYHRDYDHHHHHHHDGWRDYGFVEGLATAAVIGAVVAALPPGCASYTYSGVPYRRCGETWYRPQYRGSNVTYIVVENPS